MGGFLIPTVRVGAWSHKIGFRCTGFTVPLWAQRSEQGELAECGSLDLDGRISGDWKGHAELGQWGFHFHGSNRTGVICSPREQVCSVRFVFPVFARGKIFARLFDQEWVLVVPKTLMREERRENPAFVGARSGCKTINLCIFPEEEYEFIPQLKLHRPLLETTPILFEVKEYSPEQQYLYACLIITGLLAHGYFAL